ncbi:MAG TPA: methionine--tRNA ligase subunit beta, partial [Vicinamibacteria bacterium]|nr:methionine--tRNA ligase subunit beta [Vicinamibacteria bacterium]
PGQPLGTVAPLFPRADKPGAPQPLAAPQQKETAVSDTPEPTRPEAAAPSAAPTVSDRIDISEFARLELRAARVTAAEKIAGSKKLVKLQVDLGSETRQLVAGIADAYVPETLVGRTVVVVANLKPAKLMGVESNGMVLAGSVDGKAVLCTFEAEVAPGTKVK